MWHTTPPPNVSPDETNWQLAVWPLHGSKADRRRQKPQVADLLREDNGVGKCVSCRGAMLVGYVKWRLLGSRPFGNLTLWCHACQGSHPWFLFSLSQRQESKFRRICIRTQGAMRMCTHKVIRWADLVGHATERGRTPIHLHGILCSSCANSTYTTVAYAPFVFRPLTNGQMQLIDPRPCIGSHWLELLGLRPQHLSPSFETVSPRLFTSPKPGCVWK